MMRLAGAFALSSLLLTTAAGAEKPRQPRTLSVTATAYCQKGKTATGVRTRAGIVAADPRILPLGSTVRIAHPLLGRGTYTIQDTGSAVKGRRIDIFMASCRDARRFGRRRVQVQVVSRASADATPRR